MEKARKTIEDLFTHELSDVYSAEKQITKALPRLAKAATNPLLADAFASLLEETHGHIERIDQFVELTGIKLKRMKRVAMEGLVEESKELLEEMTRELSSTQHCLARRKKWSITKLLPTAP